MPKSLTVTIDEATRARLQVAAAERAMTVEAVAEMAVAVFFDHEDLCYDLDEDAQEQIRAGLRAAERGEFASDEEVERVFARYRQR